MFFACSKDELVHRSVRLKNIPPILGAKFCLMPLVEDVFIRNDSIHVESTCFLFKIGKQRIWKLHAGLPFRLWGQHKFGLGEWRRRKREIVRQLSDRRTIIQICRDFSSGSFARIRQINNKPCWLIRRFSRLATVAYQEGISGINERSLTVSQSISRKAGLIPRCDQQSRCDDQAETLKRQFIEPCDYASQHGLLVQEIGWLLLALAVIALFAGLIVGGGSRTSSLLLLGILLVAIAFVLSQWAFELIDRV